MPFIPVQSTGHSGNLRKMRDDKCALRIVPLPAVSCQLIAGLEFVLSFHVQSELVCVFPCGDPERTLALDTG